MGTPFPPPLQLCEDMRRGASVEQKLQQIPLVERAEPQRGIIDYVLIKLAARCNLDCCYCYWFRDPSVYQLPKFISSEVLAGFSSALERHIAVNRLPKFTCSFHGGEPTLFKAGKLRPFLEKLDEIGSRTHCDIRYALTTNGVGLTDEWLDLILDFEFGVTVSIDGPPEIHDRRRLTLIGGPSWEASAKGYLDLCRHGVAPTIIAVCDPESDPVAVLDHLAGDLGIMFCDVLMPDCNHEDAAPHIAPYYIRLFDHWYENYWPKGVHVRILNEFVRSLVGLESRTESIGLAPTRTVCLNTDGMLEPHDVLRIAGSEHVRTGCSILVHELDDIQENPCWRAAETASTQLADECLRCRYKRACGGGHLAQRWSAEAGYRNPSVYCTDLIEIFDHIAHRLEQDVQVSVNGKSVPRREVLAALMRDGFASLVHAE